MWGGENVGVPAARPGDVATVRPFVGRLRERTIARQLLRQVESGSAELLLVTGVPGIGKSAFLRWFADNARARRAQTAQMTGAEGRGRWPLGRLLARWPEVRTRWSAIGTWMLLSPTDDPLSPRASPRRWRPGWRRRPVVLIIDDADRLPALSLTLVEETLGGLGQGAHGHATVMVVLSAGAPGPGRFRTPNASARQRSATVA